MKIKLVTSPSLIPSNAMNEYIICVKNTTLNYCRTICYIFVQIVELTLDL